MKEWEKTDGTTIVESETGEEQELDDQVQPTLFLSRKLIYRKFKSQNNFKIGWHDRVTALNYT